MVVLSLEELLCLKRLFQPCLVLPSKPLCQLSHPTLYHPSHLLSPTPIIPSTDPAPFPAIGPQASLKDRETFCQQGELGPANLGSRSHFASNGCVTPKGHFSSLTLCRLTK